MTIDLTDIQTLVIGTAALVVAWGALWRGLLKPVWKRVKAIHDLIEHELTPNGGSSMKDTTTYAAEAVDGAVTAAQAAAASADSLAKQVADVAGSQETIFELLDNVVATNGRQHEEIWRALEAHGIDRRHPPADPGNGDT